MKPGVLVIWRQWGKRTAGAEFHLLTQAVTHHLPIILSGNTKTEAQTGYLEIITVVSNIKKMEPKPNLESQFCTTVEETR
jgi:hypothetical protein